MNATGRAVLAAALLVLTALPARALTVALDPGHSPDRPGALGVRGVHEVTYNDTITQRVAEALRAAGFTVVITRQPDEALALTDRPARASQQQADVFLSLHHDSAQPQYLQPITVDGRSAWQTTRPIRGYSLFVSQRNPQYERSLQLAQALGRALRTLGRAPTLHHAEKISGENRELLDTELGIYRFDDLVVLHRTTLPAVLLEVGVIVDREDEAWVSNPRQQQRVADAIVRALQDWRAAGAGPIAAAGRAGLE